jgi:hypothetical protein
MLPDPIMLRADFITRDTALATRAGLYNNDGRMDLHCVIWQTVDEVYPWSSRVQNKMMCGNHATEKGIGVVGPELEQVMLFQG